MKIQIREKKRNLTLTLPTRMIFSKFVRNLLLKNDRHVSELENLPKDAADRLLGELKQIKKRYGAWDLVEVDCADGEYVKITL